MIATSLLERCSFVRSTIGPMLSWVTVSSWRRFPVKPLKCPCCMASRFWPQFSVAAAREAAEVVDVERPVTDDRLLRRWHAEVEPVVDLAR